MGTILRAKLVIVGDTCSGKSALTQVFHSDGSHFPKNYSMTIGVDLVVKSVHIPETNDTVELYMFDSAGKEVFFEQVQKDWDHPGLMMVVYDCTNEATFNACVKWIERVRSQKPEMQIPGALVANKVDLDERRVISPKAGRQLADQHGLEYFEVSARPVRSSGEEDNSHFLIKFGNLKKRKTQKDLETPFYYLANEFYKLYKERVEVTNTLSI